MLDDDNTALDEDAATLDDETFLLEDEHKTLDELFTSLRELDELEAIRDELDEDITPLDDDLSFWKLEELIESIELLLDPSLELRMTVSEELLDCTTLEQDATLLDDETFWREDERTTLDEDSGSGPE